MNPIRKGIFGIVLCGLTACASPPPQKDIYYSLVLANADTAAPVVNKAAMAQIVIGPISVAHYLDQPGLAMQVGTHQVQTANHHLWAEPLDEAIGKVLVRDIAQRTDGVPVDRDAGRWSRDGQCQLRVEFDKFHATDNSRVVAAGRYWVHEKSLSRITKREFDLVQTLTGDGYAHAVRELTASLARLGDAIVKHMATDTACLSMARAEVKQAKPTQ